MMIRQQQKRTQKRQKHVSISFLLGGSFSLLRLSLILCHLIYLSSSFHIVGQLSSYHHLQRISSSSSSPPQQQQHYQKQRHQRCRRRRFFVTSLSQDGSADTTSFVPKNNNDDHQHDDRLKKILSYVKSLQRGRKNGDKKAAKSLNAYLLHNPIIDHPNIYNNNNNNNNKDDDEDDDDNKVSSYSDAFERALVQAFRMAGEAGDYKLILSLLQSSILHANNHPILTPRIFGEALDALSRTKSNVSKLKYVWNLMISQQQQQQQANNNNSNNFLKSPATAFELNVMIKAMASRGKIRACIDLYENHTTTIPTITNKNHDNKSHDVITPVTIVPDAYTASTLFKILADSITSDLEATAEPRRINPPTEGNAAFLQQSLIDLSYSPCWQWNTAITMLDTLLPSQHQEEQNGRWNNHVFASLLKLNDRAQEVFKERHKNGPKITLAILEAMTQQGVTPDVVTCTQAMQSFGETKYVDGNISWKLAMNLLEQMINRPELPNPNVYTYSAAIVACARCHEYSVALQLLEDMRIGTSSLVMNKKDNDDDSLTIIKPPQPNAWVYNAALLALRELGNSSTNDNISNRHSRRRKNTKSGNHQERIERRTLALDLLTQMHHDHEEQGMDTAPDTVTYNTVLAIAASDVRFDEPDKAFLNSTVELVDKLLDQMKETRIRRDAITYQQAILAMSDDCDVLRMVENALADSTSISTSFQSTEISIRPSKPLDGMAADGMTFVFNTALSALASRGDLKNFMVAFSKMQQADIRTNSDTIVHIISALGRVSDRVEILTLLTALGENQDTEIARQYLSEQYGIDLLQKGTLPPLDVNHYAAAISTCLVANDIENAHRILSRMKEDKFDAPIESLQKFSLAYARAAVTAATEESKRNSQRGRDNRQPTEESLSRKQAHRAYSITMALNDPPIHVWSTVAKACATVGMWEEAKSLLRTIHQKILVTQKDVGSDLEGIELVPTLHRSLLQQCAKKGNVTAALWYVDDIQRLSWKIRSLQEPMDVAPISMDTSLEVEGSKESFVSSLRTLPSDKGELVIFGMKAEDWCLLLIAASKSGHWRVCISTLQFLRPFLERLHPSVASEEEKENFQRRYDQFSPALTTALRCLEQRSQYGWALRAIDDWMLWSGRRPRFEAVLSAMRILSARGRGDEVSSLALKCTLQEANTVTTRQNVSYEEKIYIGAITALHHNGLYDDADDVFISAVSQGHLVFTIDQQDDQVLLDLHGMNVALAHSAVRVALRKQAMDFDPANQSDMVIVTGRGRNSALAMRPVLRPEVQRMLLEEFYPPLNTMSVPGNMGALRVSADDICAWQSHQQEQKGARMLAVAAVLKNLSSVDRLRKSIATSLASTDDQDSKDE